VNVSGFGSRQTSEQKSRPMAEAGTRAMILATVKENATLTAIDEETGAITAAVEVGERGVAKPHEITLSADRTRAFVSLYGSADYGPNVPANRIAVVGLTSMRLLGHIDLNLYMGPHALVTGADGKIWASVDPSRCVLVIDPDSWEIERTIWLEVPGHFFAAAPDGRLYVSAKEYPVITEIDMAAREIVARIPLPVGAQGICVSSDGALLYVGDFHRPLLHAVDRAARRVIDTVPLTGVPGWPFASKGGAHVVVPTYDEPAEKGFLEILDVSDLTRRRVVDLPAEPFHVLFAPDHRDCYVALASGEIPKISLKNATIVAGGFHAGGTMPEALVRVES
jgi:DNA-binding beta-propeller fold protein YncE